MADQERSTGHASAGGRPVEGDGAVGQVHRAVAYLLASGRVRLGVDEVAGWRRTPPCPPGVTLASGFLKHADEQTVAALAAVFRALAGSTLSPGELTGWGVLAAPRSLARPAMACALERFRQEGAWGLSPHLIPHRSLHSISGTLSHALQLHGPNFGAGSPPEVLTAAFAMLSRQPPPGLWVVLTAPDPDCRPDGSGQPVPGSQFLAVALALAPSETAAQPRARLEFLPPARPTRLIEPQTDRAAGVLEQVSALLETPAHGSASAETLDLGPWGRLTWQRRHGVGPFNTGRPHLRLGASAVPAGCATQEAQP
jgi:hypothetical protein